jgi:pyruvate/2-oxoglutarate dehydrogenase complex dihydrolipoamide dehydrogenase (E3) component
MVKSNIDMLMGNLKFEDTEKAIYTLSSDGWAKTIVAERSRELMGQKMSTKVSTTLKD